MSKITTPNPGPAPYTANGNAYNVVVDFRFVALDPPEPIANETGANSFAQGALSANMPSRIEIEALTPSSRALQEIARKSPPPQEWWDEDFEGL